MSLSLDFILTLMTVCGIGSSWFFFLVIKPLRDTTDILRTEIDKLREVTEDAEKDMRRLDSRISALEGKTDSLTQRVQNLEDIWRK